jgi:hypothetical protein
MQPMDTSSKTAEAIDTLRALRAQGYELVVKTRVDVIDHKIGPHPITCAGRLVIEGDEPLSNKLREAVREHRDLLLVAACVCAPPQEPPWVSELVRRYRRGYKMETRRQVPYRKRDGSVGLKNAAVTASITPATLAANLAAFVGKHPVHDAPVLEELR